MKILILTTLFIFVIFNVNSQEGKNIRKQGYLLITASKGSSMDKIGRIGSVVFVPLEEMKKDFNSTVIYAKKPKRKLYLAQSLTEKTINIKDTESAISNYLKLEKFHLPRLLSQSKDIFQKSITKIRIKQKGENKDIQYYILFIDGLWQEQIIPWKWQSAIPIGNYRNNNVDQTFKKGYTYCFLKEIKAISYKLDFVDDKTIEMIN